MWLNETRKARNMPWLRRGMRFAMNGRPGRVTGGNGHTNINVRFDGQNFTSNVHPWWEMVYFNKDGTIIADYRGDVWKSM